MYSSCAGEKSEPKHLLNNTNCRILFSAFAIAILFDTFIFQPFVGLAYPLFMLSLLAFTYYVTRQRLVKHRYGWALIVPLILLSMTYVLFSNELFRSVNSVVIPAIFMAHVLLVTENNLYEWYRWRFFKDIMSGILRRPVEYVSKPFFLIWMLISETGEGPNSTAAKKIAMGLIISLPIVFFVTVLLSSADLVFERLIQTILSSINFDVLLKHSIIIGIITPLTFSFFWGLDNQCTDQTIDEDRLRKLDEIILATCLVSLIAVYALFCYIQFSYLFGSMAKNLPDGLTYAQYARKGFFELLGVALLNTAIVGLSLDTIKLAEPYFSRLLKVLNSVLVCSTFVMLFSAFHRMFLYEEVYGYTYLRVLTQAGMVTLLIMLCATLYKVWVDRVNLAKWYITITLLSYVVVNYANIDAFIAQRNVDSYHRTGNIDVGYLNNLSFDVVPYLTDLTRDPNRQIALAALKGLTDKTLILSENRAWQGYNLSQQRAKQYPVLIGR